jgi:hypothetical protein
LHPPRKPAPDAMTRSGRQTRHSWEYADGPEVGDAVPITSEPRDEEKPGVLSAPQEAGDHGHAEGGDAGGGDRSETEEREVRAADPELSGETNERLTAELREAVAADRVEVPADRPSPTHGDRPERQGAGAYLTMHRWQFLRAFAIVLTFGAIVSLATGKWWLLPVAAGIHAIGTMTVTLAAIRLTTISEHPSPQLAAAMSEEGVSSPDERFSSMVAEFRQTPGRGTGDVLAPGSNERTVSASADPANASAEQSSAMTPTAEPSRPAGEGAVPDLVVWTTIGSLLVVSIGVSAAAGGWMWLLAAVMIPLLAGWALIQRLMTAGRGQEELRRPRAIVTIVFGTGVAVAAFCAAVAFAFQH